jgi:hypothetical protein
MPIRRREERSKKKFQHSLTIGGSAIQSKQFEKEVRANIISLSLDWICLLFQARRLPSDGIVFPQLKPGMTGGIAASEVISERQEWDVRYISAVYTMYRLC